MGLRKFSKLEMQVMDALWQNSACSIRETQETFPAKGRPAYTTIQTTVYRLETKKAVRRVKKISNAHIFEAIVSRDAAHRGLIDDLMNYFGGEGRTVMAHLIDAGKLTLDDVEDARTTLKNLSKRSKR